MQWAALKLYLAAGPARRLDVQAVARARAAHSAKALAEAPLFDSPLLNRVILLKGLPVGRDSIHFADAAGAPMATVVFAPTDSEHPEDGGRSCVFFEGEAEARFRRWLLSEQSEVSELDIAKLRVINSVPTFSKPLFEIAFCRAGISVSTNYAHLPADLRKTLAEHLRVRLRSLLVTAAGKTAAVDVEPTAARYVTNLLCPSADAHTSISPLIEALKLPPGRGWHILLAWVGLIYYETQIVGLQTPSRDFISWLKIARSRERLYGNDHEVMASILQTVQTQARETWRQIRSFSDVYRYSHEAMLLEGDISLFINFLNRTPVFYRWVGEVIGRLEQCVYLWKRQMSRFDNQPLPYNELFELVTMLGRVLSPITPPPFPQMQQRLSA